MADPVLRILVLSFYYPPDLGPGALRAAAVVSAIRRLAPASALVEIITTCPHRYPNQRAGAGQPPQHGVRIDRLHTGSGRLAGFARFALGVRRITADHAYDAVFATSARLGTALLAARVATVQGCPLLLDLRDDVVADVQNVFGVTGRLMAFPLALLEHYALSRAAGVSLVSRAHVEQFGQAWPSTDFLLVPHGVAPGLGLGASREAAARGGRIVVMYAGTVGEAQTIHLLIPALASRLQASHEFVIVGGGSRFTELARRVAHLPNVMLRDPVSAPELAGMYARVDVLFASLQAGPAFERVVPSKLYEMVASGLPIVAGVSGEAAKFLRLHAPEARIFAPGDLAAAFDALASAWSARRADRTEFLARYDQDTVIAPLASRVVALAARQGASA